MKEYEKSIKEAFRVLKNKGKFLMVIPHPAHIIQFRSINVDDPKKYLTEQQANFKWGQFGEICEIPTEFHLRPLQKYFSDLRKSGFIVNDIIEPRISDDAQKDLDEIHTLDVWETLNEKI